MSDEIIDPTRSRSRAGASEPDAPRPELLHGLRVGLLENTKRNAATVLDAVGSVLAERHGIGDLVRRTKKEFAMPMHDDLVDELRRECDVIVMGVGDCGSCSAAAVADGIRLEQAGVPTAVICTDAFESTSRAMAELKGDAGYPFILTDHPVANLTEEQIVSRADVLADQVTERLLLRRAAGEVA
jgi:hypothetical protein